MVTDPSGLAPRPSAGPRVLLWRFHALGDVVLATGVAAALSRDVELWVATEERFQPVFAGLVPPERLLTRAAVEAGPDVHFERVVDLQGTPGSRRLARRIAPATASVRTRSAARRWIVLWGDRFPRPRLPHAAVRYAAAAALCSSRAASCGEETLRSIAPRVVVRPEEEIEARRLAPAVFAAAGGPAIALLTGASRRTKEYPRASFLEVAARLGAAGARVWWVEPPGAQPGPGPPGSEVLRLPLAPLKAALARASAAVSCDSGPMHLATALGLPVLGLFGSTVPRFGFAPLGGRAEVLEVDDLPCRPCGVHGREACWLGHWRCLRELEPARVAAEALRLLDRPRGARGGFHDVA